MSELTSRPSDGFLKLCAVHCQYPESVLAHRIRESWWNSNRTCEIVSQRADDRNKAIGLVGSKSEVLKKRRTSSSISTFREELFKLIDYHHESRPIAISVRYQDSMERIKFAAVP